MSKLNPGRKLGLLSKGVGEPPELGEAQKVVGQLLSERDDINKLPGTPLGRRYARLKGMAGVTKAKFNLFNRLAAQTAHVSPTGFRNRDAVGPVKHTF